MRHDIHPALAVVLTGALVFCSCTSYKRIEPTSVSPDDDVRVTLSDGRQLELTDVRVLADTLRGVGDAGMAVSFPASDVTIVQAKAFDGWKTAGLVLGIGAAALGAAFVTFLIVCDGGTFGPDC
jgi:hypothetical protein